MMGNTSAPAAADYLHKLLAFMSDPKAMVAELDRIAEVQTELAASTAVNQETFAAAAAERRNAQDAIARSEEKLAVLAKRSEEISAAQLALEADRAAVASRAAETDARNEAMDAQEREYSVRLSNFEQRQAAIAIEVGKAIAAAEKREREATDTIAKAQAERNQLNAKRAALKEALGE